MAKKKQISFLIIFSISLLLVRCASQGSPKGGEVDKVPPTIVETYPESGTINFKESTIEISFSEYVNKRAMKDAFFISPLLESTPNFTWTNRTVEIEFNEIFKDSTTYSIVIGTEITDVNNNNKMIAPFTLTFSTGDKIDSGFVSGKVFSDNSESTMIFAYRIDTGIVDIYTQKPSYISQIDKNGFYSLTGLSNGIFNLYAINDDFKDLVYNIGTDKIGIPSTEVELNNEVKFADNINFILHKEDTLAPNIQAITMIDKYHIVLEFNEPVDSFLISSNNFIVYDSTESTSSSIKYLYRGNIKKNEYILCLNDSLNIDNNIFLHSTNITDKHNNLLDKEETNFIPNDKPDTNFIKLLKIETPFEKSTIDYLNPSFTLHFSDAFDTTLATDGIKILTSDSVNLPINFDFLNDASVKISIPMKLKSKKDYLLKMDMNYIVDLANNNIDTVITKIISTINDLDFTGASGEVKTSENKNIKVVLKEIEKRKMSIQTDVDSNSKFNISRVLPGKYIVWAYEDKDSNNIYSNGNVYPLEFSEIFTIYPDTLNLRSRWPVGDIQINFNNK